MKIVLQQFHKYKMLLEQVELQNLAYATLEE